MKIRMEWDYNVNLEEGRWFFKSISFCCAPMCDRIMGMSEGDKSAIEVLVHDADREAGCQVDFRMGDDIKFCPFCGSQIVVIVHKEAT